MTLTKQEAATLSISKLNMHYILSISFVVIPLMQFYIYFDMVTSLMLMSFRCDTLSTGKRHFHWPKRQYFRFK